VKEGEAIGIVYCGDSSAGHEAARRIQSAYHVADEPLAEPQKLVKEVINE
jgi:hypothetical protein